MAGRLKITNLKQLGVKMSQETLVATSPVLLFFIYLFIFFNKNRVKTVMVEIVFLDPNADNGDRR